MSFSDHSSPSLALTSAPAFNSALMISGLGTFSDAASVSAFAPSSSGWSIVATVAGSLSLRQRDAVAAIAT